MRKKGTFKGRGGRFQTELDWRKIFLQWVIIFSQSGEKSKPITTEKTSSFFWYFYSTTTQHSYAKPEQSNNILDSHSKTLLYLLLVLGIMPVGFKVLVHFRFLIAILGRGSFGRSQDTGTTFFVRFLYALDIILNVIIKESKGWRPFRENLSRFGKELRYV